MLTLSGVSANRYDELKFDGTVFKATPSTGVQSSGSFRTMASDTTYSKRDFSLIANNADGSLYKILSYALYAYDTLGYFSNKILAKGSGRNYVINSNWNGSITTNGNSTHASVLQVVDTAHFKNLSYPHYTYAKLVKINAGTTLNGLGANDTMHKNPWPDIIEISFYAKSYSGKTYDYETEVYWPYKATIDVNFDVNTTAKLSITPTWTLQKIRVPFKNMPVAKPGYNKITGSSTDVLFTFTLPTTMPFNDSISFYGIKFDQIHLLEDGSDSLMTGTANIAAAAVQQTVKLLRAYNGIVSLPGSSFRTGTTSNGMIVIPNSQPDPYGGNTASEIFKYGTTTGILYENEVGSAIYSYPRGQFRTSYWYKWIPQGIPAADTNFATTHTVAFTNAGIIQTSFGNSTATTSQRLNWTSDWKRVDTINTRNTFVSSFSVTTGGSGYGTPPTVVVSAPDVGGGATAAGTAVLTGGVVTSITVSNNGLGYLNPPTIALTGGGGTGATATANLALNTARTGTLGIAPTFIPSGRSFSVWGMQLEDSTAVPASTTRPTGAGQAIADTAYANYIIDGVLDLSKVTQGTTNDRKWVQYALDLCKSISNKGCRVVQLKPRTYLFNDTTLCVPDGITLQGISGSTTINMSFPVLTNGIVMHNNWVSTTDTAIYLPYVSGSMATIPAVNTKVKAIVNGVSVTGVISGVISTEFKPVTTGALPSEGIIVLSKSGSTINLNIDRTFPHNRFPSLFRIGSTLTIVTADELTTLGTAVARGPEDYKRTWSEYTGIKDITIKGVSNIDMAVSTGANFAEWCTISNVIIEGGFKMRRGFDIGNPSTTWTGDIMVRSTLGKLTAHRALNEAFYFRKINTTQVDEISAAYAPVGIRLHTILPFYNVHVESCDTAFLFARQARDISQTEQLSPSLITHMYSEDNKIDLYVSQMSDVRINSYKMFGRVVVIDSSILTLTQTRGRPKPMEIRDKSVVRVLGTSNGVNPIGVYTANMFKDVFDDDPIQSSLPYSEFWQGASLLGGTVRNAHLSDTTYLNNTILDGRAINYWRYSDSMPFNVSSRDRILTPWGTMTADSFNFVKTQTSQAILQMGAEGAIPVSLTVPYTFSFYVKVVSTNLTAMPIFEFKGLSAGNDAKKAMSLISYIDHKRSEWVRYEVTGYRTSETTLLEFAIRNNDNNNFIFYLAGVQLNNGRTARSLVHTSGLPKFDSTINIQTAGNKPIKFVNTNINLSTGKYLTFNGDGSTATGMRDSSGVIQLKTTGGVWGLPGETIHSYASTDYTSFTANTWADIITVNIPTAGRWELQSQSLLAMLSSTDIKQIIDARLTDSATNTIPISFERKTYKVTAGDTYDYVNMDNLGIITTTAPTTIVLQVRLSNAATFNGVMSGLSGEHQRATQIIAKRIN